jgi:hypothetical protein
MKNTGATMVNPTKQIFALIFLMFSTASYAGLITVDYDGSYNETAAPLGDYDNIGGVDDVALFNLIEGNNTFSGTVDRDSDFFAIGIGFGLRLIGATVDWATNLPNISFTSFNVPNGYLEQTGTGQLFIEQSTNDPEIYTFNSLRGPTSDQPIVTPTAIDGAFFEAPVLSVEEGIYNSLLNGNGVCASTWQSGQFLTNIGCVDGNDYTITYIVERFATPPPPPPGPVTNVPTPSTLLLLAFGLIMTRRFTKK